MSYEEYVNDLKSATIRGISKRDDLKKILERAISMTSELISCEQRWQIRKDISSFIKSMEDEGLCE